MKLETFILKAAICLVGLAILAICDLLLPTLMGAGNIGYYWPIIVCLYVTAVPFFVALYQTLKLLGLINKNKAFSKLSAISLGRIKVCALIISAVYALGLPYFYYAADQDDAPGVLAIALIIIFASLATAVFASVLQQLSLKSPKKSPSQ